MLVNPTNDLDRKKAETYFTKLMQGKSKFELKREVKKKSVSNNAYLHVCITLYSIHFGNTLKDAKKHLKRNCSMMIEEYLGCYELRSCADLNNDECYDFSQWIRNYSAPLGCYIPSPQEYKDNRYEIDRDIKKHKQYL